MHIASLEGFGRKKKNSNPVPKEQVGIFPISIGQAYHEDHDQVRAIFFEACNHFNILSIPIGDYIYRHTLQIEKKYNGNEQKAIEEAERRGKIWEENHSFIKTIAGTKNVTVEFVHWKEEFDNPKRERSYQIIERLFHSNPHIRSNISLAANQFACNYHKANAERVEELVDIPDAAELCLNYIKEELSIFLLWRKKYNTKYFFYPFQHNIVSKYILEALKLIFEDEEVKHMFDDIEENSLDLLNVSVAPVPQGKKDKKNKQPNMQEDNSSASMVISADNPQQQAVSKNTYISIPDINADCMEETNATSGSPNISDAESPVSTSPKKKTLMHAKHPMDAVQENNHSSTIIGLPEQNYSRNLGFFANSNNVNSSSSSSPKFMSNANSLHGSPVGENSPSPTNRKTFSGEIPSPTNRKPFSGEIPSASEPTLLIYNQLRMEAEQGRAPTDNDLDIAARLIHKLNVLSQANSLAQQAKNQEVQVLQNVQDVQNDNNIVSLVPTSKNK